MPTLTGDLGALVGELQPPIYAWVVPDTPHIVETGEVLLGSTEIALEEDGTFSVALPNGFYQVKVRYYDPARERLRTWLSGSFQLAGADLDLADAVAVTYSPQRPAIDHGNVSGDVDLDAAYALHELNLTGPTTIIPIGAAGADIAIRVTGTGTLTLGGGAEWDTNPLVVPGTALLTNWQAAGWRAAAVAPVELIEVTPAAPTFTDGTNTITVPASPAGALYYVDGNLLAVGPNHGYPEGDVLVTWLPAAGYEPAAGTADDTWAHTFGPLTAAPLEPDEVTTATLVNWWDASAPGALTIISTLIDQINDLGPNNNDLVATSAGQRPGQTTVNSKAAAATSASTEMRALSLPAALDTYPVTIWAVVRITSAPSIQTLAGGPNPLIRVNGDTIQARSDPGGGGAFVSITPNTYPGTFFVAFRHPPTGGGASKLWVNDTTNTATISGLEGLDHWIALTHTGAFCEGGTFDGSVSDAEIAGLFAYAAAKWGIA